MNALIPITASVITFSSLFNRSQSKEEEFSATLVVALIELVKCGSAWAILRFYFQQRTFDFTNAKNYASVALLYLLANVLLFLIYQSMSAGTAFVLSQHRILWTAGLSTLVLGRAYSRVQLVGCFLNMVGVLMVLYVHALVTYDTLGYLYVLAHGATSSMAAVLIEKNMMKTPKTFKAYLEDSLQLYAVGLPMYFAGVLISGDTRCPPKIVPIVVITATQGMIVGAVFKFLSALDRSFIQSLATVLVVLLSKLMVDPQEDGVLTHHFFNGTLLVLLSTYIFKTKVLDPHMLVLVSSFIIITNTVKYL
jgi:drug/metabolite transporter (DMT)-like permease